MCYHVPVRRRSLPGGRSRPRHHGPAPGSGQRGPATCTVASTGSPRPIEGGPEERSSEGTPAKELGDGMAHHFGPGMGYFLLEFWCAVVLVHWQHRSSEGRGAEGGREGPSPLYCEI